MADQNQMDEVFAVLVDIIHKQRVIMDEMARQIKRIDSIGGGGGGTGNGFQVYESNHVYKRYQAVIDPNTDTAYLVVPHGGADEYTSITVETDCHDGNLKLIGFDSQIVTTDQPLKQEQIDALPEHVVVVEYNASDTPYNHILDGDN